MFYNPTAARRMVCYCLLTVFIFILAGCSNKNTHKQSNDSIEMNTQEDNNLEESNESSSNDDSELEHNTAMHDLSIMAINLEDTDCTLVQIDRKNFLINTGNKESVPIIIRSLAILDVDYIDGIILMDDDDNTCGGLLGLSARYQINDVYIASDIQNMKVENESEDEIDSDEYSSCLEEFIRQSDSNVTSLQGFTPWVVEEDVTFDWIQLSSDSQEEHEASICTLKVNNQSILFVRDLSSLITLSEDIRNVIRDCNIMVVGSNSESHDIEIGKSDIFTMDTVIVTANLEENTEDFHESIKEIFRDSDLFIPQDFICGTLLKINKDNDVTITNPPVQVIDTSVIISELWKDTQECTLLNQGDEIDISNYFVYSSHGAEVIVIPEGTKLAKGSTYTITTNDGNGDLQSVFDRIWNESEEDIAFLYDRNGNLISIKAAE